MNDPLYSVPLLSAKELNKYTPEEYKALVRGLYFKPEPKSAKKKSAYSAGITKTGSLRLRVNRDPKWLTAAEVSEIRKIADLNAAEAFIELKKRDIDISTQAEQDKINKKLKQIPW